MYKMIVNVHKSEGGRLVLAICDKELIDRKFEEKGLQLDLTSDFYKGKEIDEKILKKLLKAAYIVNLVGEKSIKIAMEEGLIRKENVMLIKKIPHAQILIEG